MANCCPRTCSRLATAAAFISIGIVQFISGMLLLRSRFVYLLSGPNFWTAAANISVGGLLGISAAIWKTTNKKSVRHVTRRNVLASLVSSSIVLNATTTAILIVGEGNILLSIHLESREAFNSTLLAAEILGYTYAASVCSPIVAVVVAVAFLLGLCFQVKSHKSKKLDIQSTVRDDTPDIYSWVYTPRLPKPDLDVMRIAVSSSGSGTSSSDSDCASSDEVPVLLRSLTPQYTITRPASVRDKVSYFRETLYDPVEKRTLKSSYLRSNCSSSNKVSFANEFVLDERTGLSIPTSHNKLCCSSLSKAVDAIPASATHKAHKYRLLTKKRSRVRPKILFKEYPSGEIIGHSDNEVFKNTSKDSGSLAKQDTHFKKSSNSDSFPRVHNSSNFRNAGKKSKEFPILHTEALQPSDIIDDIPEYQHTSLRRTSTTDDSKFIKAIASPEGSEVCFDSVFVTKGIHNESQEHVKNISIGKDFATRNSACENNESSLPGEVITIPVKDSDFRAKLSAKLVRVPTPVVSDIRSNLKVPRRYSYSVTNGVHTEINNKPDYSQPSFSSFRNEIKSKIKVDGSLNELDATKYHKRHSSMLKSPMDSISELPAEEINEQSLTSAQTSGYMSADESGDNSSKLNTSKNSEQSPSITKHVDTSRKTENKKSDYPKKLKSSDFRSIAASHKSKVQKAIENFASENPDITVEDLVSHLLQTV